METIQFLNSVTFNILLFLVGGIVGGYIGWKLRDEKKQKPPFKGGDALRKYDQTIRALITTEDKKQGWFADLTPSELERMYTLAAGVITGRGLSGAVWAGHGRLFSRAEFEMLTQLMVDLGWVVWNSPHSHNQGLKVTNAGLAAFKYLAQQKPHHPIGFKPGTPPITQPVTYAHTRTR